MSSGRARYVGVSNYSGWQTARAFSLLESARVPLVANEIEYSLAHRDVEREVVPAAQALGVGLLAWSPLARGVLTGKYRNGVPSDSRAASRDFPQFAERFLDARSGSVVEAVATAARGLKVSPTEVALAWVRDRPGESLPPSSAPAAPRSCTPPWPARASSCRASSSTPSTRSARGAGADAGVAVAAHVVDGMPTG